MCGMMGIMTGAREFFADDFIKDSFTTSMLRGVDSSGIAMIDPDTQRSLVHKLPIAGNFFVEDKVAAEIIKAAGAARSLTMCHVRAATVGKVTVSNAHPFEINTGDKKQLMEEVWSGLFTNLKEELNKSDKATEALVEIHKDYKNSVKNYLEAKLEADYWFSVKESFDKKAHFVKELGEFFIAGILNKMEVKAPTSVIAEADYEERRKKIRSKK